MKVISLLRNAPLLFKVVSAILLGIVCSLFFPHSLTRVFVTLNSIISNFIGMFIPILIIGLISSGISDLGKDAGKLLLFTTALAYLSTVLAGGFSYGICALVYPHILEPGALNGVQSESQSALTPYFTIEMPAFIDVMTALVIAFILGAAMVYIKSRALKKCCDELREIVMMVIGKIIIPILPLYIFGIFLKMGQEGFDGRSMALLAKIIVFIFAIHITVLVLQFLIAGFVSHRNPFKSLLTMFPAYATALGTSSSAATIPVTLEQAKKLGVHPEIADFTVPLCATIHLPCSLLKITACAYALMFTMGMPVSAGTMIHFILISAVALIAAPGVPGGSIMAAFGPLSSVLGFSPDMQAIMIALYIAMDPFGTAGNVTGDGALTMIADRFFGKKMLREPLAL